MRFTGRLDGLMVDYSTGKLKIILTVNEDIRAEYDKLKDCEKLSVEFKKWRAKRSLDANAYYWQLLTKVADALHVSMPYMHNQMLIKNCRPYIVGGKVVYVVIPDTDEASRQAEEATTYHLKPTDDVREGKDGLPYRTYMMLRGSSDYDSKEMSSLIDHLVVEAKQLGIETFPLTNWKG